MITAPQGAERSRLSNWSTPRLIRYLRSRVAIRSSFHSRHCPCYPGCSCGPWFSHEDKQADEAMKAEIDFIKNILNVREHVERK